MLLSRSDGLEQAVVGGAGQRRRRDVRDGILSPGVKAESQSLKRIFQGAMRYTVPLYQRPYVWRRDENDPERDRLGLNQA